MLGRGWSEHCLSNIGESSLALHRETLCLGRDIRGGTVSQGRKFILQRVWCWPEEVERTVPKAQMLRDLGGLLERMKGRVSSSVTTCRENGRRLPLACPSAGLLGPGVFFCNSQTPEPVSPYWLVAG